jgi:hypothetical protein
MGPAAGGGIGERGQACLQLQGPAARFPVRSHENDDRRSRRPRPAPALMANSNATGHHP